MTLHPGHAAPDIELYTTDGTKTRLSHYWRDQPIVLTFLRHFGCQFCREIIARLRTGYSALTEHGLGVVAVGQGSPSQAAYFSSTFRVPFPILTDPARQGYQAFDIPEGKLSKTLKPDVTYQMLAAATRGHLPDLPQHVRSYTGKDGSSIRQLGSTFLVNRDGLIRYAHLASPIYANPTVEELLAAADRELAGAALPTAA